MGSLWSGNVYIQIYPPVSKLLVSSGLFGLFFSGCLIQTFPQSVRTDQSNVQRLEDTVQPGRRSSYFDKIWLQEVDKQPCQCRNWFKLMFKREGEKFFREFSEIGYASFPAGIKVALSHEQAF